MLEIKIVLSFWIVAVAYHAYKIGKLQDKIDEQEKTIKNNSGLLLEHHYELRRIKSHLVLD